MDFVLKNGRKFASLRSLQVHVWYVYIYCSECCAWWLVAHSCGLMDGWRLCAYMSSSLSHNVLLQFSSVLNIIWLSTACSLYVFWLLLLLLLLLNGSPDFSSHKWMYVCVSVESVSPVALRLWWWWWCGKSFVWRDDAAVAIAVMAEYLLSKLWGRVTHCFFSVFFLFSPDVCFSFFCFVS